MYGNRKGEAAAEKLFNGFTIFGRKILGPAEEGFGMYQDGARRQYYLDSRGNIMYDLDRNYLELIERIYSCLSSIHSKAIDILEKAGNASSLAEAQNYMAMINERDLLNTFRTYKLCADLQNFTSKNVMAPLRTDNSLIEWQDFKNSIYKHEYSLARAYDELFSDIRCIAYNPPSLEFFREKIGKKKEYISEQQKEFNLLANIAKSMLKVPK